MAFAEPEADAWVATASANGVPHLVPLSIGWTGERIVLVTESRSLTARNLVASGQARLALGGSRDVVNVSAELVADYAMADAPASLLGAFSSQSGWNPATGTDADTFRLLELRIVRIQTWRGANEISGRTLMRNGEWGGPGSY